MIRGMALILAIGLFVLWIVALGQHATPWLTWLDLLAALFGFAIVVGAGAVTGLAFGIGAPMALAIGLFVLWIIALATHADSWLSWWTFGFACAFFFAAIVGGAAHDHDRVSTRGTTSHPHPI